MSSFIGSIFKIGDIEQLATKSSFIHRLHPLAKTLVTVFYIIAIASFEKYEVSGLLIFLIYPISILYLAYIPLKTILNRIIVVMPFVLLIGVFNPFFDHTPQFLLFDIMITGGWLSFLSLAIKGIMSFSSAILLVATSGIFQITKALRIMRLPTIFILQLLLLYRYIAIIFDELHRVWNAYQLRSNNSKGLIYKVWGSLVGQALLRAYDRAIRVYHAMLLRGFSNDYSTTQKTDLHSKDYMYIFGWLLFFLVFRFFNLSSFLGELFLKRV